jgi:hypothetical protein
MEIRNKTVRPFTEGEKEVRREVRGEIILTGDEILSYPQFWKWHLCPLINDIAGEVIGDKRRVNIPVKPGVLYQSIAILFDEIANEGLEETTLEKFLMVNQNLKDKLIQLGVIKQGVVDRVKLLRYLSNSVIVANFAYVTW